jgi:lysophospholipase L1-like esterase
MSDYKDPRPAASTSSADPCAVYDNAVTLNELLNSSDAVTTYKGKELKSIVSVLDEIEDLALARSRTSIPTSLTAGQSSVTISGFNASLSAYYLIAPLGSDVPAYRLFKDVHYTVANGTTESITLVETYPAGYFIAATSLDPLGTGSVIESINTNDATGIISAKMWNGSTVKIACYGDSTTDGNQTTSWTANPTSGGNAVGNSNHNLTAPNAWPAKLQSILRDMYNNENISVFNAGYSGKRMDNGWALANYDAAVVNNPYYGTPDLTFVMFGLNDIQDTGSQLTNHVAQTRLLIEKIIADGTTPVLLTCDPEYRNGQFGNVQDHKEVRRELDSAKKSIAIEYGIKLLDMGESLRDWIENNTDGYRWTVEQTDALHFQDNGHAYKAQYIAAQLANDLVVFDGGEKVINTWSSQTEYVGDYSGIYKFANNSQGGCVVYGSGAPASTDMMTMWIWSKCPSAYLVYQGVHNEGCNTGSFTVSPKVIAKELFSNSSTEKSVISTGGAAAPAAYRRSDEQFIHSKLKYGLNKVTYKSGDAAAIFYGNFKIVESSKVIPQNAMLEAGRFVRSYSGSGTTRKIEVMPKSARLANTAGCFDGETLSVSFTVSCPVGGGFVVLNGQGYDGSQTAIDLNRQNSILLYRNASNQIELFKVNHNSAGTVNFELIATGSASSWATDQISGRFEMSKSGGMQTINVYNAFSGGTSILTSSVDGLFRWSGTVGGTFYNPTVTSLDATIDIKELVINR